MTVNLEFLGSVYRAAGAVSAWVFPCRCLVCTEPGQHRRDLCGPCAAGLPQMPVACPHCALPLPADADAGQPCGRCQRRRPPLQLAAAAFVYGAPVDGLLRRFKFHQDLAAGRLLAELMCQPMATLPQPDALMPVPLHRARLRRRGYDQALELARPLATALQLPLCQGLRRVRATAPQSELDAAARRRNLKAAFVAKGPLPQHVALVDDVMTTGATLHAAAIALRRAGVQRVDAWVCARVP
jgi:ComF family protein